MISPEGTLRAVSLPKNISDEDKVSLVTVKGAPSIHIDEKNEPEINEDAIKEAEENEQAGDAPKSKLTAYSCAMDNITIVLIGS